MSDRLGILFPVCDADERHFRRFMDELDRLELPFAVHFDHCTKKTKNFFKGSPLCIDWWEDDDPESFFDESFRQKPLDRLIKHGFTHALQMDVDETLEPQAPRKIREALALGADVTWFPILDLWGDGRHYRVDGPMAGGGREKIFKLKGNWVSYPHPTSHAPNVCPEGKTKEDAKVIRFPCFILHWGIMNLEDAEFHRQRWQEIYARKVGGNPYGSYDWFFDPATVPVVKEFDPDTFDPKDLSK